MAMKKTRRTRANAWEYRAFVFVGTLYFLVIVAAMRLLPRAWRPAFLGGAGDGSLFDDARTAASVTVGYAFMP